MHYFKGVSALFINTYVFVVVISLAFIVPLGYHSIIVREEGFERIFL